jgi:formate dehydrogenase major subunit
VPLDPKRGLTVVEIMNAIHAGEIEGMYIMGENPAMSDPDMHHARQALAKLKHLVVQDIFLTETAWHADVVLPASVFPEKTGTFTNTDRRIQLGRTALPLPGQARLDLDIIIDLANRLGCGWNYQGVGEVYAEMAGTMPSLNNISWERLQREGAMTYPADGPGVPGNEILFSAGFPTASGRGKIVPANIRPPDELPDEQYPYVLSTGRVLEHWHTGAMTRRAAVLDAIEPDPTAMMHPLDLEAFGAQAGDVITVASRRGIISLYARADEGTPRGAVFIPFCFYEAAANLLTNPVLDPFGKIPEFKYCAVKVMRGGELMPRSSYGGGQAFAELNA